MAGQPRMPDVPHRSGPGDARRRHPGAWVRAPLVATVLLALVACSGAPIASGPSPTAASPRASPGPAVPLADALATLSPRAVWAHFSDLERIPRASHQEARATAFVAAFGRSLGFQTIVDRVGNVMVRAPATAGMEGRPGVVLQAHLDMVTVKTAASTIDFVSDPIQAVVQDGWVHALGTTLGADDGIGVAIIMALLEARDVAHGPLEALFTVDEEDLFTGVSNLAPDLLQGSRSINVDNEDDGQLLISSAGGAYVEASRPYAQVSTPGGMTGVRITVDGLLGGHSGADIDKGRGSAHQIMARLLLGAPAALGVRVASLAGGDIQNAIPSMASALVALPPGQAGALEAYVREFGAKIAGELAASDPKVALTAAPATLPARVMDATDQATLIGVVAAAPQGVVRMSADVPGLVETSSNLGVLTIADGMFTASDFVRSALDAERDSLAQRCSRLFADAGAAVTVDGAYLAWPPNLASPLLAVMKGAYATLFGTAPAVAAMHIGLETSVVRATYPAMDMVSVGPTLRDVHSPDERLEVASVAKVYSLLVATLAQAR